MTYSFASSHAVSAPASRTVWASGMAVAGGSEGAAEGRGEGEACGPTGVAAALIGDGPDVPLALVAVTWKVYAAPFVNPATFKDTTPPEAEIRLPPGDTTTVYAVTGHTLAALDQLTTAVALPGAADIALGADGTARLT
jgi:hypothetical protein